MVRITGVINPVVAEFITTSLKRPTLRDDRAFLIELDTPGGLDTSMRAIIQGILGSEVPVIVYVYPSGARAASAGALITLAADFAAMAPGTNIGAAHPVSIGFGGGGEQKGSTMMEKVLNDAVAYARSIAQQRGRNVEMGRKHRPQEHLHPGRRGPEAQGDRPDRRGRAGPSCNSPGRPHAICGAARS